MHQLSTCLINNNSYFITYMNIKNLAMWAVIVILTIGLYNMFKNPQRAANQNNTIIFSEFLNEVENGELFKLIFKEII